MMSRILAKNGPLTSFTFSRLTWAAFAVTLAVSLNICTTALAQGTFQDGDGAVEYNEGAAPATPTVLPGKVKSSPDSAPSPMRKSSPNRVGRRAAEKYMGQTPSRESSGDSESSTRSRGSRHSGDADLHYLAIHFGLFTSDVAFKWGDSDKTKHPANYNMGVSYRLGEWVNSMDLNVRVDFTEYSLTGGSSSKLSFLPMITFPDVASRFPLYFGVGAGLGVFMHQLADESSVAFEYQVIGGLRFFDVLPNTGFFIEGGIKNHVLLLTDGQFNGPFVALGSVFLF